MRKMKTEAYINKILKETNLEREQIQEMVEKKREELKGLISEEGALFVLAKELNVNLNDRLIELEINISELNPSTKNVTLIGRVKDIYKGRNYNKKEGGTGYVASFFLQDNTGNVRVVVWDDNLRLFFEPEFGMNCLVKIINGHPKMGKFGDIEIHVGRFGKIIVSPEDVDHEKYLKITDDVILIKDIKESHQAITVEGKIIEKSRINEFTKEGGEKGKVSSLRLIDATGTIIVIFWGNDVEKLKGVEVSDVVTITKLYPRKSNLVPTVIELNAGISSILTKQSKKIKIPI